MLTLAIARQRLGFAAQRLKRHARRIVQAGKKAAPGGSGNRRYLSDQPARTEAFLQAARDYVSNRTPDEQAWLYRKPFDPSPGNSHYYMETLQVLNLLQAMEITPRGRVLEVGSGPGWVSEILLALEFEVDGIEPCSDMIDIARERVAGAISHYRLTDPPRVDFHLTTLEDCDFEPASFDAVLFHAALHHVIDEGQGLAKCARVLRPGAVLGVSEYAWSPGNRQLEAALEEEMRRFGTLENPYTQEYLEELLLRHGFEDIQRYHAVNGWFPASMGGCTLESVARPAASGSNNLTARKRGGHGLTTAHTHARTLAEIEVLATSFDAAQREARIKVRLTNKGETAWLKGPRANCHVQVALRQADVPGGHGLESLERHGLGETVAPGKSVTLDLSFHVPEKWRQAVWCLDLVNEGAFWFSARGTQPAKVRLSN